MSYQTLLEKKQNSPNSRVARMRPVLNYQTLEWDTEYTLVLQNTKGKIIYHTVMVRTLSMSR